MLLEASLGATVRLVLAWSGVGRSLAWATEVSTPLNSGLELREGIELYKLGVSPYSGSSCRTPPLALWLYSSLAQNDVFYVLPNIVIDLLTALLLHRVASFLFRPSAGGMDPERLPATGGAVPAKRGSSSGTATSAVPAVVAWAYLLNPFTLAASAAGTTSSLEGLAVAVALYGAVLRRPSLAALGLALAAYMSLHAVVLLLPVSCLLAYGSEDVATPLALVASPPAADQHGQAASRPGRFAPMVADGSVTQHQGGDAGGSTAKALQGVTGETPGALRRGEQKAASMEPGDEVQEPRQPQLRPAGQQAQQEQEALDRSDGLAQGRSAAAERDSGYAPMGQYAPPLGSAPASPPAEAEAATSPLAPSLPVLPWCSLARTGTYLAGWLLLIAISSELYLAPLASSTTSFGLHPSPKTGSPLCLATLADHLLLQPPWAPVVASLRDQVLHGDKVPAAVPSVAAHSPGPPAAADRAAARLVRVAKGLAGEVGRRAAAARTAMGSCWVVRVYGSQVLLDDVTPNVGQWWYLAMEAFEDCRVYIRLLAHSLVAALAPPLAIRLGTRRPLALFLLQLLALALLKPHPSIADLGLAAALLPLLARQQLAVLRLRLLLPASLALLCVLGPAMLRMWLGYESANSNFFYSVTLLFGVWQVVLLGQLLALTLRVDRAARGKDAGLASQGGWSAT